MRRPRDLDLHDWLMLSLAAVLIGCGLWLASGAIDSYRAEHGGIAGQVTVEDCVLDNSGRGGPSWECSGRFVSDDGAVRIDGVTLNESFHEPPADGSTVAAKVTGSSADTAYTDDTRWLLVGAATIFFFGLSVSFLVSALRGEPGGDESRFPVDPATAAAAFAKRHLGDRADEFQPLTPVAAAPTLAAAAVVGKNRANIAIWKVAAAWLLLVLTIGGVLWHLAVWNRDQDALLSAIAVGTVSADHLGADNRIEVVFRDDDGADWWVRLTPLDNDRFLEGSQVPLRYDPAQPEHAVPVYPESFSLDPRDRNIWAGLVLSPGIVLLWAWTWRLGRWALGSVRRRAPATARVHVAELTWSTEPTAFWLELESDGRTWYQRVAWDRRLVHWFDGRLWDADLTPLQVQLRRCPGLRRMYLVDAAGVGRLWPASTARRRPPRNYDLRPFSLGQFRSAEPNGRDLKLVGGLAVLAAMGWLLAGPVGSAYLLALIGAYQLWVGGAPWRGFYAVRP
ncbi:hypothetical protein [Micromonospora sp. NPDC051296]|uniref:hypothetical protein n=1 Tax=Micromonospora sp. NPDC051296 TaxID=3155046 RepID=UPI00342A4EFE